VADALSLVRLDGASVERPIALHAGGEVVKASCATVDFSIKVNASPTFRSFRFFELPG